MIALRPPFVIPITFGATVLPAACGGGSDAASKSAAESAATADADMGTM